MVGPRKTCEKMGLKERRMGSVSSANRDKREIQGKEWDLQRQDSPVLNRRFKHLGVISYE